MGWGDGLSDFGDFSVANQDGAVLDSAVRNREDGGVLDEQDRREWVGSFGAK